MLLSDGDAEALTLDMRRQRVELTGASATPRSQPAPVVFVILHAAQLGLTALMSL